MYVVFCIVNVKQVGSIKIGDGLQIKNIAFTSDNTQFLVNCSDCNIYVYSMMDNSRSFVINDKVDKSEWTVATFCRDDYILTASSRKVEHKIFIWNRHTGELVTALEGPYEVLLDASVHTKTKLTIVASKNTSHSINICSKKIIYMEQNS